MKLIFKLSMPGNNAWNGKWSGEGNLYAKIRSVGTSKKAVEHAREIVRKGYYTYHFGDGWIAGIEIYELTSSTEARSINKRTRGFCGYDWMIDSILSDGEIKVKERSVQHA